MTSRLCERPRLSSPHPLSWFDLSLVSGCSIHGGSLELRYGGWEHQRESVTHRSDASPPSAPFFLPFLISVTFDIYISSESIAELLRLSALRLREVRISDKLSESHPWRNFCN